MTKRFWLGWALILVVPGLLFTVSCAKKTVMSEPGAAEDTQGAGGMEDARARQNTLEEQRLQEERLRGEARVRRQHAEKEAFQNEPIYFEYDESRLLPEAKAELKRKAKWMFANPGVSIIIEGHCDDRGSNEYNMALGDRRAQSAKNYLIDLGIKAGRTTTISYGEERPVDFGRNESAWAKNRRAKFVIQ